MEKEQSNKIAYGRFITDLQTKYNLNNLCKRLGIPSVSDEYHTTVLYSKENVDRLLSYNPSLNFPLVCDVVGYDLFGEEKNCLVLKLAHPDLYNTFNELKSLGASYDYPDYTPHLTLTYKFKGDLPTKLPRFKVKLTGYKSEESIDDYKPEDKEVSISEGSKENKMTESNNPLIRFQEKVSEAKLSQWAGKFKQYAKETGNETATHSDVGLKGKPSAEALNYIKAIAVRAFPNLSLTATVALEHDKGKNYIVVRPTKSTKDGMIAQYDMEKDEITLYDYKV